MNDTVMAADVLNDHQRFRRAFELVIGHEGGFTDNPHDRGNWTTGRPGTGELKGTKYGIAAHAWPMEDIRNMTLDRAREIYREAYWEAGRADLLPDGAAYLHFDGCVNMGVARQVRFMQSAAGTMPDGIIGPNTRRAIRRASARPDDFMQEMMALRIKHYMDLDSLNDTFGLGWARRCVSVLVEAVDFAQEVAATRIDTSGVNVASNSSFDRSRNR